MEAEVALLLAYGNDGIMTERREATIFLFCSLQIRRTKQGENITKIFSDNPVVNTREIRTETDKNAMVSKLSSIRAARRKRLRAIRRKGGGRVGGGRRRSTRSVGGGSRGSTSSGSGYGEGVSNYDSSGVAEPSHEGSFYSSGGSQGTSLFEESSHMETQVSVVWYALILVVVGGLLAVIIRSHTSGAGVVATVKKIVMGGDDETTMAPESNVPAILRGAAYFMVVLAFLVNLYFAMLLSDDDPGSLVNMMYRSMGFAMVNVIAVILMIVTAVVDSYGPLVLGAFFAAINLFLFSRSLYTTEGITKLVNKLDQVFLGIYFDMDLTKLSPEMEAKRTAINEFLGTVQNRIATGEITNAWHLWQVIRNEYKETVLDNPGPLLLENGTAGGESTAGGGSSDSSGGTSEYGGSLS